MAVEIKQTKDMTLGELVEAMFLTRIQHESALTSYSLSDRIPESRIAEGNRKTTEVYEKKWDELRGELDKREQLYKPNF